MPKVEAALTPGAKLGPYEIVALIGAGGMGAVYRARDTRLGRTVAIKVSTGPFNSRFESEARAIAALNHPHVCTLYDVGPNYLVMEFVDGAPLRGPVSTDEAMRIAKQIASALEAAHALGILHRDLKPANILLSKTGAKLLDFGLAKLLSQGGEDLTQTRDGTVLGTVAYMSPEQTRGQALDERSDIFSFGSTLYELVSGTRAFTGGSATEVMSSVLRDQPAPLASPLWKVVERCLAKAPSERFQSMTEVCAALNGPTTRHDERPSIVVLPFVNVSRDPDDEYFSDGLSEEIINALASVGGLKVIARTSAFALKGKQEDVRRIADTLGVTNVLEGSVRRAGSRVRITTQLVQAVDGVQLWSQRYDPELTDIFAVQDEISGSIVGALRVRFTPGTKRYEPNLAAHEAYLKGLGHYRVHEPDKFARAEGFFREAIRLDPGWAEPHSLLAEGHVTTALLGLRPLEDAIADARAEATRAIELRPEDPTALAALGAISAAYDRDWSAAAEAFRRALSTGSATPNVLSRRALYYLLPLARFEEAIAACEQAGALDPLNHWRRVELLVALSWAGEYDRAAALAEEARKEGRAGHLEYMMIGVRDLFAGNLEAARRALEEGYRDAPWHAGLAGWLAGVVANLGDVDRAREILDGMRGGLVGSGMMTYHMVRGEIESAIDYFERAVAQRQPNAAQMISSKFLSPLHASPRWANLRRSMNLPPT